MHVRIQTWFRLTIQVYVNGHNWLAMQLHARKIGLCSKTTPSPSATTGAPRNLWPSSSINSTWVKLLDGWTLRGNPSLSHD